MTPYGTIQGHGHTYVWCLYCEWHEHIAFQGKAGMVRARELWLEHAALKQPHIIENDCE